MWEEEIEQFKPENQRKINFLVKVHMYELKEHRKENIQLIANMNRI